MTVPDWAADAENAAANIGSRWTVHPLFTKTQKLRKALRSEPRIFDGVHSNNALELQTQYCQEALDPVVSSVGQCIMNVSLKAVPQSLQHVRTTEVAVRLK